jgi:hypothetical protein
MAAFLANVGVNAGHAARSPIFDDGSFRLIPIPEAVPWRPPMIRFGDLEDLSRNAPRSWRLQAAHLDPDLAAPSPTYGDNCRTAARAFSLRRAHQGDLIVFVARLQPLAGPAGFHLVGCLVIDDLLSDVIADPGPGWWDANAHIRRGRAQRKWNSFWVFKGGDGTRLLEQARPFGRDQAEAVFGSGWRWRVNRTELQTIGSYTRSVRRVESQGEKWLRAICLT